MYTRQAVSDMHARAHRSLRKLLEHCEQLSPEQRDRELPGFGYPSVRLQIHHLIGAEEYWIGVLQGKFEVEDNDAAYPTIAALEEYRAQVAQATDAYLSAASESELNTSREMVTWQGKKRSLVPAHVVIRTLTHIYQHQGQVLAMCRLHGSPCSGGLDYPID
jgi:uncharacterized damage-inducible protein DinB